MPNSFTLLSRFAFSNSSCAKVSMSLSFGQSNFAMLNAARELKDRLPESAIERTLVLSPALRARSAVDKNPLALVPYFFRKAANSLFGKGFAFLGCFRLIGFLFLDTFRPSPIGAK